MKTTNATRSKRLLNHNTKILERGKIDTPNTNTQLHDRSFS
jgi:hypothetical protein